MKPQSKNPISTIFWDVGGVLFSEAQISRAEYRPVLDLLRISVQKSDEIFDTLWPKKVKIGKITENEYWQEYIRKSKNKPSVEKIKTLYRSCIQVNETLLNVIQNISKSYPQYIVSNHGREWMDYLIKHWNLKKYFKDIFCSGYLGIGKPDKEFFKIAMRIAGAKPENTLYIDDNKDNLSSAESFGVQTILFQGYLSEGTPKLLQKLRYLNDWTFNPLTILSTK